MLKKIKLLAVFSFISCTTPETKRAESQWIDLDHVGSISCSAWPIKESELDISQMIPSNGSKGGFIATMRMRNGSVMPMYASTGNSEIVKTDDLQSFPIGRNAYVIASAEWNNDPIAFIIQNKNERAWLEIRAIRDNKLVARMPTPVAEEVYSGRIVPSAKGWWLQLSHSETDSSFVNVTPEKNADWQFTLSHFQSKTRFAAIVASGSSLTADVVEMSRANDENTSQFKVTRLETAGRFKNLGQVSLPSKGGTESWSATAVGNRLLLAFVHGDSMIGQASLTVTALSVNEPELVAAWSKEFPLADVHLGEPLWITNGGKALVGLVKWIDGEGTLSRVKADAFGAEALPDIGVFEKGTVLVSGYLGAKERGLGAFRYRVNDLWKYKLCKLSL